MKVLATIDQRLFHWISEQVTRFDERRTMLFFKTVSKTGDGHLYFVLAALLFLLDEAHGTLFLYTALLAYALEIPIYIVLKHLFKRRRPSELFVHCSSVIIPSDKFSLPSGHTAAAFLMATVIFQFYPAVSPLAFIWASCVGLSRIVLRVHFPLDVLVGMALGISLAVVSMSILG